MTGAGGRAWPYAGLVLGGGVSVAANIAHSYVPPARPRPGWTPSPGAVLLAAFWPAAVFVAVEIMARATLGRRPTLGARPLGRPRPRRARRRRRLLPPPRRAPRLLRRRPRHRRHRTPRRRRTHDRLDRRPARHVAPATSGGRPRPPTPASTAAVDPVEPLDSTQPIDRVERAAERAEPYAGRVDEPAAVDPVASAGSAAAALDERAVPARVVALMSADQRTTTDERGRLPARGRRATQGRRHGRGDPLADQVRARPETPADQHQVRQGSRTTDQQRGMDTRPAGTPRTPEQDQEHAQQHLKINQHEKQPARSDTESKNERPHPCT